MSPSGRGALFALLGTLILTPDTLLMRLSGLEPVAMTAWRGVLMGVVFLTVWLAGMRRREARLRHVISGKGLIVIACQTCHIFLFSFGVSVAPVAYVLLGLATVPVVSALLSHALLGERTDRGAWATIALVITGLALAVLSGDGAGQGDALAQSNPALGALAGLAVAVLIATSFLCFRADPKLPVGATMGMGALTGGLIAGCLAGRQALLAGDLTPIALTGLVILPVSFLLLTAATRLTRTATVSLMMLLETILGPFWLWLCLGEAITPGMLIGGAVVIVPLAVFIRHQARNLS